MQIGMVGLGKMGMNMATRLIKGGHEVVAYDISGDRTDEMSRKGAETVRSLEEMSGALKQPRIFWLMLPAGKPVDTTVEKLNGILQKNDIIIDGGNSFYKDDMRLMLQVNPSGIHYMDVGVSGGIWGLEEGYCLMVGGERKIFNYIEPILKTFAPQDGYLYCGPAGAGHFLKMVHNGIEYGMMAAYGEGFDILNSSFYSKDLDFSAVAHLWNHGSVVRSWLLELVENVFRREGKLEDVKGYVEDSGEGRWILQQAIDSSVPAPVIALSLFERFRSRQKDSFSDKLQAALRREFGGHAVLKQEDIPDSLIK